MHASIRTLIAGAALALLAGCATTGEETDQAELPTDQQGVAAQPGQETYSYGYGQAPGNYDSYDTSGSGNYAGGKAGAATTGGSYTGAGGAYTQAAPGGMGSTDRIVYFDFDQATVRPEGRAVVETNSRYLASNPKIITQLEGHTDNRGSREYNIALGERRANTVRQMMGAMGVAPQQMRVVSFGKERPAAHGYDEQSHALNRRVEIVY